MEQSYKANNIFFNIVWGAACLIIALSLLVPDGYSIGAILIVILSFSLPFIKSSYKLSFLDKIFILSFLLYSCGMFYFVYIDGFNTRWLDKPSRFLIAIFPLILLLKVVLIKKALVISCFIGSLGPFGVAIIERFYLGYPRAEGDENPIMFGGISMLIAMICLNYAFYFYKKNKLKWFLFSLVSFFSGLFASFLSGSKGSWLVLPVAVIFLLWNYRKILNKKIWANIFISISLVVAGASFIPSLGVSSRVDILISDIEQYLDGNKAESSISHRTELWKASLSMFHDSPYIGVGRNEQQSFKQDLVDKDLLHESVMRFTHAHNEYLNELGLHGIFGLLFLLIVYLVPLGLFVTKIRKHSSSWDVKVYSIAGALVPLCYMVFSITQAMFVHNSGVMMYVFLCVIFWAATSWAEREEMASGNIEKVAD